MCIFAARANQVYTACVSGKPQVTLKSCGIHHNTNRLCAPPIFILWSAWVWWTVYQVLCNAQWIMVRKCGVRRPLARPRHSW